MPLSNASGLGTLRLSRCTFGLVIRWPIPAITRSQAMMDGNAAASYRNAVDKSQFAASGRYLLWHEGVDGLNHSRGGVVKWLFAPPFGRSVGDVHGLIGVHDKGRYELHAIGGGDSFVTACPGVEHAVGVASQSVVQRDWIFMLANTLLACVLGKEILGVQIAPIAIAAHQTCRRASGTGDYPYPAQAEKGIPLLIVKPGDLRHVNVGLLGFDHPVFDPGLQFRVLPELQDTIRIVGSDIAARVLHDLIGRIADLERRLIVVHRVLF